MGAGRTRFAAALLAVLAAYALFYAIFAGVVPADPDALFHLAFSRETWAHGIVHRLPQADDLGWAAGFHDKEFLFHMLTTAAYGIGGEKAVLLVPALLLAATGAALLWVASLFVELPLATAVAALFPLLSPVVFLRLADLRAYGLAVPSLIVMAGGFAAGRVAVTAAAAAVFASGYHALYVPLLLICAFLAADRGRTRDGRRLAAAGALGLLAGAVLNPYFPGNLAAGSKSLLIALRNLVELPTVDVVLENKPLSTDSFLFKAGPSLLILACGLIALGRGGAAGREREKNGRMLAALVGSIAVFWAWACVIPRPIEYAVPLTLVLLAALLARAPSPRTAARAAFGVLLALTVPLAVHGYLVSPRGGGAKERALELEAIDRIPEIPGKKVFNCVFGQSPAIYYRRPDLRFVDISDPLLLYLADRRKSDLRHALRDGEVGDALGLLRGVFHADYVLCGDDRVNVQLDADPHFHRLYPEQVGPATFAARVPFLFAVEEKVLPNFVTSFELAPAAPMSERDYLKSAPGDFSAAATHREAPGGFLAGPPDGGADPTLIRCALARVPVEEVREHRGAPILGIGGGRNLRVFLNGKRLFVTEQAQALPRAIAYLIPLPRPLAAADRLEVVFCSAEAMHFMGLSVSFWSRPQLEAVCAGRETPRYLGSWPRYGGGEHTCLAPFAAP